MIIRKFQPLLEQRLKDKNPLIQILIGPRQVGKTTAAQAIEASWMGPKLIASADSPAPPQSNWITYHWEQARLKGEGTLLILDEIQKIPGWSEQVKILFDADRGRRDIRVLLLGSSSLYLQKGLKESLAGRFELVHAHHWSAAEFKEAFGWDHDRYLRFGAYPSAVGFAEDEPRWRSYILNGIIEPVIGRDILGQNPVNNPALFRQAFELAVQHPAQVVSLQKLLGQLQDRGNAATIKNYLNLLEQSFILKTLQKYTGSVIQSRASSPKIVVLNPALIHAYQSQERLTRDPAWYGRVFESVIGAHLLQIPDSELFYWREGADEVDYILRTPQKTTAIEIKSGFPRAPHKGLLAFARRYPGIACESWDLKRCLEFLEDGKVDR